MAAEKGSAFLLKLSNGATPPIFTTLAGLRATGLTINSDAVNITNKDSNGWRTLLSGAGLRSVSLTGSGVFTNSTAETQLRTNAMTGVLDSYRIVFESGDSLSGQFLITRLDYSGDYNGERTYAVSLESSGATEFVAA
jgi:TP901-1 family phage major tail protein